MCCSSLKEAADKWSEIVGSCESGYCVRASVCFYLSRCQPLVQEEETLLMAA